MFLRHSAIIAILCAGLSVQDPPLWRIRDAPAELRSAIARGDLVIVALQGSVLRELADKFAQGGADLAINSCHIDSLRMTRQAAREGIVLGRTSDRLRNPTNTPPYWAAAIVKSYAGRAAKEVDGFAVDLGDRVGLLRPIAEREICGNCHGPADRLSPAVRAVLKERYPVDKAVDFHQGDVRGWFWAEVPKAR